MGNLHAGHASLIGAAHLHGRRVVASVFVNPLQFGPNEDFAAYPRTPEDDSALLEEQGVGRAVPADRGGDVPARQRRQHHRRRAGALRASCAARYRPGHFQGVATVVVKLLNLVQPDVAIFGEKDYQQLTIIRRSVEDLCLPVKIVGAPTVRADDGLALSSRNRYLNDRGARHRAEALSRARPRAPPPRVGRHRHRRHRAGRASRRCGPPASGPTTSRCAWRTRSRSQPGAGRRRGGARGGRLGRARLIDNLQCRATGEPGVGGQRLVTVATERRLAPDALTVTPSAAHCPLSATCSPFRQRPPHVSRTTALGSSRRDSSAAMASPCGRIAERHRDVAQPALVTDAADRTAGRALQELRFGPGEQLDQPWRIEAVSRRKSGSAVTFA